MSKYPESEKINNNAEKIEIIEEFLEYLACQGIYLGMHSIPDGFIPFQKTNQKIIYSYLNINENKLEGERLEMLNSMRKANEK